MKKNIHPAFGAIALIFIVGIATYFLSHAATDKPIYPGLNAGHPAAEMSGAPSQPLDGPITPAQADKMKIPGRTANMVKPKENIGGRSGTGQ